MNKVIILLILATCTIPCAGQWDVAIQFGGIWQNEEYGTRNDDDMFFLYSGLGKDSSQPVSVSPGERLSESGFYLNAGLNGSYKVIKRLALFSELRFISSLKNAPVVQQAMLDDYSFNYEARLKEYQQSYFEIYLGPRGVLPIGETAEWILSAGPVLTWQQNERKYHIEPDYSEDKVDQSIRRTSFDVGWQGGLHHQANWNDHFGHRVGIEVFYANIQPEKLEITAYQVNGRSRIGRFEESELHYTLEDNTNNPVEVQPEKYSIFRVSLSFMLIYKF